MTKISVITPIYRTEKFLDKCLQSHIDQTLDDIEFIWVDNGASNESREIIEKYCRQRPNIKVIHVKDNIGYGGAMNTGLEVATGDYIGFCDSDDWIDKNYYEELYNNAEAVNADIAYTNYRLMYEDKELPRLHLISAGCIENLVDKINALKDGAIWDKIFKRKLIFDNDIKFPTNPRSYYQDNMLLLQAAKNSGKMILINGPQYYYRQNYSSLMHNVGQSAERREYMIIAIEYALNYAMDNQFDAKEKEAVFYFLQRSLAIKNVIKNKTDYPRLKNLIAKDDVFSGLIKQIYRAEYPAFWQRIFSVQNSFGRKSLWILGIKIKFKKQKTSK